MNMRYLEGNDAVTLIISVLKDANRPMTTKEIQKETESRRVRCPDSTAIFLNRLRIRGLINGGRSEEQRGWVWWVDD